MIRKTVNKGRVKQLDEAGQNLEYWLSRPAEERISAVEILRRQVYGDSPRLQRVVKVIHRS
jgi:pyridoxine/pyridoxamine 5'-phosphate oxidase